MDTKITNVKRGLTDSLQMMADMSMETIKFSVENASKNLENMNKIVSGLGLPFTLPFGKSKHKCCPPYEECPPHCLIQINRNATVGERIVVPFIVKNKCGDVRTYKVGVRELKSLDGNLAPAQPTLNKSSITLEPHQSESILMSIDLEKFPAGETFQTEIVLREKDINQNICFRLTTDSYRNLPVAEPLDEKKHLLRWQSWQSHFYCEPSKLTLKG